MDSTRIAQIGIEGFCKRLKRKKQQPLTKYFPYPPSGICKRYIIHPNLVFFSTINMFLVGGIYAW